MIKKFNEFVVEAAGSGSHHGEANKIIAKHGKGGDIDRQGAGQYSPHAHFHAHGISHKQISGLHDSLKAAGFTHHGDTGHVGSSNHFRDGEDKGYHTFSKGKTKVHVASRVNHEGDHHVVEVETPKGKG